MALVSELQKLHSSDIFQRIFECVRSPIFDLYVLPSEKQIVVKRLLFSAVQDFMKLVLECLLALLGISQ